MCERLTATPLGHRVNRVNKKKINLFLPYISSNIYEFSWFLSFQWFKFACFLGTNGSLLSSGTPGSPLLSTFSRGKGDFLETDQLKGDLV